MMMSNIPSAQTAIDILTGLQNKVGSPSLAYWVTPNSVLTLSGARAYCDGVFYHPGENQLSQLTEWVDQLNTTIEALTSVADVYFAEAKIDKTTSGEKFASYDALFTQGLKFVLDTTKLLGGDKFELIGQKPTGEKLTEAMRSLLKQKEKTKHMSKESLDRIAVGILLGYPDEAILSSVFEWENDDPFAEPLIDADIRGSRYYICPQPVYSYPRSMVTNPKINAHEQRWSKILQDFYTSSFHKTLAKNPDFKSKARDLETVQIVLLFIHSF